jgi:hypothetical protein
MMFWKVLKYSKDSPRILYYFVVLQSVKIVEDTQKRAVSDQPQR